MKRLNLKIAMESQPNLEAEIEVLLGYTDNLLNQVDDTKHTDCRSPYAQGVNAAYHDNY